MPSKVFPVSEANEGSRHATSTVVTYEGELLLLIFLDNSTVSLTKIEK